MASWVWAQEQSANIQRSHSVVVAFKIVKAHAFGKVKRWGRVWEELGEGKAYDPSMFCGILKENIEKCIFHPQNNTDYVISDYLSNNTLAK